MQTENNNATDLVDDSIIDAANNVDNSGPEETASNGHSPDLIPDVRSKTRNDFTDEQKVSQWAKFGIYMQEARERLKLTQKAAAMRAGIKTNTWWRLENGKNGPQPDTVVKIAVALEVDELTVYHEAGYNISEEAIKTTHETKQIGVRLRRWREYRQYSSQFVASQLKIPLTEYLLYEAGTLPISAFLLKKAAEVVNIPTNDLLHEGPVLPPEVPNLSLETVTRVELIQWQECLLGEITEIKRLMTQISRDIHNCQIDNGASDRHHT